MNFALFPARGGGGGTQKGFIPGGSAPRSNPLPFYIPFFFREGTPFVYLLLEKGTPFIYLLNSRPFLNIPKLVKSLPFYIPET